MKSTSLCFSISLLCSLSIIVYGAPVHGPGHYQLISRSGVSPHVGFSQDVVEDEQLPIGRPDLTDEVSQTIDNLPSETPLPTTELMGMSHEKSEAMPLTTEETDESTYSHGRFFPPPETWPIPRPSRTKGPVTQPRTEEEPLFFVTDTPPPETYEFVDMLLAFDSEALITWASARPIRAWSIVVSMLVLLLVASIAIVEIGGVVFLTLQQNGLDWRSCLCLHRRRRIRLDGPETSLTRGVEKGSDDEECP